MTPADVTAMFKSYMDEADTTFITTPQIEIYLDQAYSDFRQAVCNVDPYIYATELVFSATGTKVDLKTALGAAGDILCGPTATAGKKLERVLRLARVGSDNEVLRYLDPAPSEKTISFDGYALVNTNLILGGSYTGSFRLEYVPHHNIDFTGGTSAYLDELDNFHDMIPLYAYLRYAIRDGADLPQVNQELARKVKNLETYLEQGRSHEGSQYVDYYDNWAW